MNVKYFLNLFPTTPHPFKHNNASVVEYSNDVYWLVLDILKIVDIINMQDYIFS